MRMTPVMVIIGSLIVFWASLSIVVIIPLFTMAHIKPSDIWVPMNEKQTKGHHLYVTNGCSYCHSLYIRVNDWGVGADRISQAGDYNGQQPPILGTERTGPDLSQQGGLHPYDWHISHFVNPRNTSPMSLMPNWQFLGREKIDYLIAYMQYLGWKDARVRVARQEYWKKREIEAYQSGADSNVTWLYNHIPANWRPLPNPYPATSASYYRGMRMYEQFCMGCHGTIGDGRGPGAPFIYPPPFNFTELRRNLYDGKYIGAVIYYQVMNGITGTAMPFFKKYLESAKIWDLANYIGVAYIGYTDAGIAPKGIKASYEPIWKNPYKPPQE